MAWLFLGSFLVLQLGIGAYAARRVGTEADFFVAGRRLGLPLVTMSLFATWFGAETCLGASGAVYEEGLSGGRADPFGYALCLVLLGVLLAARLSRGGFLTLGDLYRERFGVGSERLVVLLLVPSSLIWGGAQIRALGQVLGMTTGLSLETAIVAGAFVSIAYTFFGGLLGDVVTDLVQGVFVALGLVALFVFVLADLPSREALDEVMTSERLSLFPRSEGWLAQVDRWSVPIFGSLVAQELVARVLAARSVPVARTSAFVAAAIYLGLGSIPIALGLLGPALVPGLTDPETLIPELARRYFSSVAYLLFSCALLAAILSTVDSIFLSSAALLEHNVVSPLFGTRNEKLKLASARGLVLLSGLVAVGIALSAEGIYSLVETASSLGTAGVLVTTLVALYAKKPSHAGAVGALALGAITTPIASALGFQAPFLLSILTSALAYVVLSTGSFVTASSARR